jgi:hypothetical protein
VRVVESQRRVIVGMFAAAAVGALALAYLIDVGRSASRAAVVAGPERGETSIVRRQASVTRGIAVGVVDQRTLKRHAEFVSRAGPVRVYSALALAGSLMAGDATTNGAHQTPKTCAVVNGADYLAVTCRRNPFTDSNLLFLISGAGGPAKRERTEVQVAGIASSRVARVEAVDSQGAVHAVQLDGGAFFFEFSREAISNSVQIVTLKAYGPRGEAVELVSLPQ